jgi:hypothetical protein
MATNIDRNAIICYSPSGGFLFNQDDASLFSMVGNTNFYVYADPFGKAYSSWNGWVSDPILSQNQFKIKRGYILTYANIKVEATNGSSSFTLQEQDIDPTSFQDNLKVEQANLEFNNSFFLAKTNPFNITSFKRLQAQDNTSYVGYELDYGFKLRYEIWRQLTDFDATFISNHTEKWSVYSKQAGWSVKYNLYVGVQDPATGYVTQFIVRSSMTIFDETDSYAGVTTAITTAATSDSANLDKNILNDELTTVTASFTGDFTAFPAGFDAYFGILYIDIQNSGGYTFVEQTSSVDNPISGSIWQAKAVLVKVNNGLVTLKANIDFSKLDKTVNRYLISARLGFYKIGGGGLQTDDGINIMTDDGVQINVD